ncbi:MFS transporter [Planotetraspora silvatica]|uniref:MFS transporter n=1 Tax=Planotetraspora silvatica TaxID=234614 RepID=A0A8J3XNM9_9ACTN|nr:MFS transporter [Planotetraspora silvatica]GII47405.1 MFS transporter [Planotetraspora silvatica]
MTSLHQSSAAGGDIASRGGVGDGTSRSLRIGGRERLILAVLLTAGFTLAVDFSILNVALPTIGADVGFSLSGLQWIATAFSLCAAGFTLFFGRIADLFGRRRLFLAGVAVLGIASLIGGLAGTPWVLIVARVAQGLATAAVTPAALSLLTTSFPEGPVRDKVLGLNGALMAAGFTTGAVLGGVLTDLLSWRWAFFINVVVAVAVLALAPVVLAESRPGDRPKVDVPGAVTVSLALLAVVYGLTQAGERSWGSPHAYGALIAGAGLLVAFWAIEKRVPQPLVPMRVLRRRTVGWGNVAGLAAFATETSVVFLLTLYLQKVLGYSPLAAGLSFAVLGVGTVVGGILGPRVIGAVGGKNALVGGLLVQAAATIPLIFLGDRPGWIAVLLAATFAGGIANLVAIVGFMVTATSGLPDDEQGLATGLATMSQQVGITMGIPIMSAVATARIHALGGPTAHTVLSGISTALILNTAVCVVAAVLLAVFLRPSGRLRATA